MRLDARLAVVPLLALLGACRGGTSEAPPIVPFRGMHEMPRYDVQERAAYFEDGRTMRPPVEGTLPREAEPDPSVDSGRDAQGNYLLEVPPSAVRAAGGLESLMRRGHRQFDIYCAPCHSETGDGHGMVSQRAAALGVTFQAANLLDPGFQHLPDGRVFLTITEGVRTMPAYRAQLDVQDRWAIVAYLRALQISQGDTAASVADPDHDGIPAGADACPEQAEDRDGFEDDDGCPDPDNDADGVLDGDDLCPLVPGPASLQGCPEGSVPAAGPTPDGGVQASLTRSTEEVRG